MELSTQIAWALLAIIHLGPALPTLMPRLVERLYAVPANGETGLFLVHRGVLFAAILLIAVFAIFDPSVRRLASLALAVSMLGFLVLYLRAGAPKNSLRKIAVIDAIGLLPLGWVLVQAWT